jgi:hypothetical protein
MTDEPDPRGYFLSHEDGEELRRLGYALGFDFAGWLEARQRSGLIRRMDREREWADRTGTDLDSIYAHLRAVIENCKTMDSGAIHHQLVGLLPEVRSLDLDVAARMREKGLGHLVDRSEATAKAAWAEFGYPVGDNQ